MGNEGKMPLFSRIERIQDFVYLNKTQTKETDYWGRGVLLQYRGHTGIHQSHGVRFNRMRWSFCRDKIGEADTQEVQPRERMPQTLSG